MGEKRRRLDRFRFSHPKCCFCGGSTVTESIDHVPPKVIFVGSQIPAGSDIEFPACSTCNDSSKQYDQIAAMLALSTPREATGEERSHFLKAVRGVRNNARAAIEEMNRGFTGWRHLGREFTGQTGLKAHASALGPINRKAMFVLAAKLGLAFYYRETGRIVPRDGAVVVDMITNSRLLRDEIPEEYKLARQFQTLSRHDTREQFLFRHALMTDAPGGMFQFAFHLNFMLIAMVVENRNHHPIIMDDEHTFILGFLNALANPKIAFSTSLAFSGNA